MLAANSLGDGSKGRAGALLMSLASILFAVMVALIPFLARRIVTGEIGSSMMTVVHTVSAALGVGSRASQVQQTKCHEGVAQ